jgi:hypothetical protein
LIRTTARSGIGASAVTITKKRVRPGICKITIIKLQENCNYRAGNVVYLPNSSRGTFFLAVKWVRVRRRTRGSPALWPFRLKLASAIKTGARAFNCPRSFLHRYRIPSQSAGDAHLQRLEPRSIKINLNYAAGIQMRKFCRKILARAHRRRNSCAS